MEQELLKQFKEKFPVRPALSDPDRLVIYSSEEFGLIEAELKDFEEWFVSALSQHKEACRKALEELVRNMPTVKDVFKAGKGIKFRNDEDKLFFGDGVGLTLGMVGRYFDQKKKLIQKKI